MPSIPAGNRAGGLPGRNEAVMNTVPVILLLLILPILPGCTYAISPDLVRQSDREVTFKQLQADPDVHQGKIIILGGTIASVVPRKDATLIEIVEKKLDYWGKPQRTEKSGGRFQVLHAGYLDAMVYAPGRDITVAGEVIGSRDRPAGTRESSLLLLRDKELRVWPRERLGWSQPPWTDPLYDMYSPQMYSPQSPDKY